MKKVVALLLAALMVFTLAGCAGGKVLKDEGHAMWNALGAYKLADGTDNGWGDKSAEVFEKSAMKAISLNDVKKIDKTLYETLSKKDVKYLYTIDILVGTNNAGWTTPFVKDGKKYIADGSYAFKAGACTVEMDGSTKVYSVDQWISDPKTAYVESLTPATLYYPSWQEEADEFGMTWASNPVVTGGAGVYTMIVAQYKNASAAGTPGYGAAAILKEKKDGIEYKEDVAEHTYGIVGSFEASKWADGADIPMTADGANIWKGEVTLKAGDEWKVRADGQWIDSWGSNGYNGENFKCEADGTYVVTLNLADNTVTFQAK